MPKYNRYRTRYAGLSVGAALLLTLLIVGLLVGGVLLGGWLFMIGVGILSAHSVVGGTLSFWSAVAVAVLFRITFSAAATNVKNGD